MVLLKPNILSVNNVLLLKEVKGLIDLSELLLFKPNILFANNVGLLCKKADDGVGLDVYLVGLLDADHRQQLRPQQDQHNLSTTKLYKCPM